MPSKRTAFKFGRDLLLAALAGAVTYFVDNVASLGLSPEVAPLVTAVVLGGYRIVRGWLGAEPEAT